MSTHTKFEGNFVLEGVNEIPKSVKIFEDKHIDYVDALVGDILLNYTKGQLLNILEGIGLPERQEKALRRLIVNTIHDARNEIRDSLKLVKK